MTGELASQFAPGSSIQDAGNITRGPFPQKPSEPKSSVAGLEKLLEDAEYLLDYAAESGIPLEPEMVETIVAAEAAEKLSAEDTVKAIAAITSLSAKLQPVSAKTLRACQNDANGTVKKYRRIAIALGLFLLVSSIVSFMTSRLSTALDNDVATANELAITLNGVVMSPASATPEGVAAMNADTRNTTNLQQFLATIRDMQRVSLQLSVFVMGPKPTFGRLEVSFPVDLREEVRSKLPVFQDVRSFAKDVQERAALYYGALSNFLLPPLYAILGACAYLLRSFSEQMKNRTFLPSRTDSARFIIAAIGGGAVGLFNNFTLGENFPPLAIAFLVGYATDIFFSFLDRFQQTFAKPKPS
jgi:hypothetical protein